MALIIMTVALSSAALYFMWEATRRLSARQAALLTEAAYYSALNPCWPQVHVNGQTYAVLPEDAQRLSLRDGDEMTLAELIELLEKLEEINS